MFTGLVIGGEGIGRRLGWPTANLDVSPDATHLKDGVYAAYAWLERKKYSAALAISRKTQKVEVYLIGYRGGNFYGKKLRVDAMQQVSRMEELDSEKEMKEKIGADMEIIKETLAYVKKENAPPHNVPDGGGVRVGIVKTGWNSDVIDQVFFRCKAALADAGVSEDRIVVIDVPGSFELPFAAQTLIERHGVDVVVPLGCLIKGETMHFEYIAQAVSEGLMRVCLQSGVPVLFSVLTCLSKEQALERASPDGRDHGYEWGISAVRMALLKQQSST